MTYNEYIDGLGSMTPVLDTSRWSRYETEKDVQEYVKAQNPEDAMDEDQSSDPKSSKRQSAKQKADAPEATLKASGPVLSM